MSTMIDWWWNTIWIHVANAFDTFTELLLSALAGTTVDERHADFMSGAPKHHPSYQVTVVTRNPDGSSTIRTGTIYAVEHVPVRTYQRAIQAMIELWR